jgi:probable biosynthetic protein (TIGR04098 family)
MISLLPIIKAISPQFEERQLNLSFDECGLDSFDLLEVRVRLEKATAALIPDTQWITFKSLADIQRYLENGANDPVDEAATGGVTNRRRTAVNMPQMALGGLSESWLLKELGDIHWTMTCNALDSQSHKLTDELGNRLYATFVRVRYESTHHLKMFRENEALEFQSRLSRFGRSMFFSEGSIQGDDKEIRTSMMTTFSLRQSNNKTLLKGEPLIPADCAVHVLDSLPAFGEEYREMRRGDARELELAAQKFTVTNELLFETPYDINPYHDLNGVNLLYFAAYPLISDYCEMAFIRERHPHLVNAAGHWPLAASTIARDVFYYGNCDLDDEIVFGVNSFQPGDERKFRIATSLFRRARGQTDRQLIANIFTVKEIGA